MLAVRARAVRAWYVRTGAGGADEIENIGKPNTLLAHRKLMSTKCVVTPSGLCNTKFMISKNTIGLFQGLKSLPFSVYA